MEESHLNAATYSLIRFLVVIITTLLTSGCENKIPAWGPGPSDFSAKLPHGYFIHRSSAHQIMVAPEGWNDTIPTIPTKVVELDHDDTWVIAKQQPLRRRSPSNASDAYEEPDPNNFSYWILRLDAPQVWGPLTMPEFEEKRQGLGVPVSLRLHDVYDYRPR